MKNFDEWNKVKKEVDKRIENEKQIRNGEIWLVNLGLNVGFEMYGKNKFYTRPVLVIKNFGKNGVWIVPITSQYKKHYFIHQISKKDFANLLQIKFVDNKRFIRKIRVCDTSIFIEIKAKISKILLT